MKSLPKKVPWPILKMAWFVIRVAAVAVAAPLTAAYLLSRLNVTAMAEHPLGPSFWTIILAVVLGLGAVLWNRRIRRNQRRNSAFVRARGQAALIGVSMLPIIVGVLRTSGMSPGLIELAVLALCTGVLLLAELPVRRLAVIWFPIRIMVVSVAAALMTAYLRSGLSLEGIAEHALHPRFLTPVFAFSLAFAAALWNLRDDEESVLVRARGQFGIVGFSMVPILFEAIQMRSWHGKFGDLVALGVSICVLLLVGLTKDDDGRKAVVAAVPKPRDPADSGVRHGRKPRRPVRQHPKS